NITRALFFRHFVDFCPETLQFFGGEQVVFTSCTQNRDALYSLFSRFLCQCSQSGDADPSRQQQYRFQFFAEVETDTEWSEYIHFLIFHDFSEPFSALSFDQIKKFQCAIFFVVPVYAERPS